MTELFDKMMDRLHCQAGTSDVARAEDMSIIVGIQDATPDRANDVQILLDLLQPTNPLLTTENGQI